MSDKELRFAIDVLEPDEGRGVREFLKDPVQAIHRRWRWMILGLLVGLVGTAVVVLRITPTYRASAMLLVSSQQIPEEFVRPTVRDDSLERMNAMIGSILSANNLRSIIEEYSLYPTLREEIPMSQLVELMRRRVSIEGVQGVDQNRWTEAASRYAISFESTVPQTAADVANEIASLFTEMSIETRNQRAQLTTEFLRRQLEEAERDLREQERAVREFKETHRGELPGELEANLRKAEQLQSHRQSLSMQIAESENRLANILNTVDPNSPEARLAALKARLAEETSVHTDEHPNVAALRRQVAALERSIRSGSEGGSTPSAIRSSLASAERRTLVRMREQLADTEVQLAELDGRVAQTPRRQEELNALDEKLKVVRENYRDFLQKVQDAELAQNLESAQQGERVVVLDRAAPPTSPVRSRGRFVALGIIASFGLALGIGFLLELADPVIVSSGHAEGAMGYPVLGSVPRIS